MDRTWFDDYGDHVSRTFDRGSKTIGHGNRNRIRTKKSRRTRFMAIDNRQFHRVHIFGHKILDRME